MMLADIIARSIEKLKSASIDNPPLDARLLICHALKCDRAKLLSQSKRILTLDEISVIDVLITRRMQHESVARIIGSREFWGLNFGLNEATLEPRPDSETLIEAVLSFPKKNARILDLGTGTGCLLLSLLHEIPTASGMGVDINPRAVEQATQNAKSLGLQDRAKFITSHWFSEIENDYLNQQSPQSFPPPRGEGLREGGTTSENISQKFDIIISNPPYIPASDIPSLMSEVREHDPMLALDGGDDGLAPLSLSDPAIKEIPDPEWHHGIRDRHRPGATSR